MNIFITGGNRGLGLELVLEGARRGHHIFATVRGEQASAQLEQALQENGDLCSAVTVLQADVRDEDSIKAIADQLRQEGVKLDSIVNSAAVLIGRENGIEGLNISDVELSFDINLYGPLRVVKHLLPYLSENEGGSIINISSEAGSIHRAYGGDYPYALSKVALNMFSQQLKQLLANRGIDVWSIHPGWMRTDMGGSKAPLSPSESATAIVDIIERKVKVEAELSFIDYRGHAMEL